MKLKLRAFRAPKPAPVVVDANAPLLRVESLRIQFGPPKEPVKAVDGISFTIKAGETLAVVGESGSGKSVSALALTRLLAAPPARYVSGKIEYEGRDVLQMRRRELQGLRGKQIAYIFQEPGASLNPVFTIGYQIREVIELHRPEVKDVTAEIISALDKVGIRDPAKRIDDYPHQLSGGMQQRVMIAMALACQPKLLVADEPTTALDVTIQKQIMDLLKELKRSSNMAILLITHNFGLVGDVSREDRRGRPDGGNPEQPRPCLHACADRVRAEARPEAAPPESNRLC
jgi:ABC-type dipeptide/oligopeptide/nickel transport system ATPase component